MPIADTESATNWTVGFRFFLLINCKNYNTTTVFSTSGSKSFLRKNEKNIECWWSKSLFKLKKKESEHTHTHIFLKKKSSFNYEE